MPSVAAAAQAFSMDDNIVQQRKEYLGNKAKEYAFRCDLLESLVNGISSLNQEKQSPIRDYIKSATGEKADKLLEGSHHIKTFIRPEAGFFQVLDVSSAKGLYNGITEIINSADVAEYLAKEQGVFLLAGDSFVWPDDKLTLRASFSLSRERIIEAVGRMNSALNKLEIEPRNPGIQR